MPVLHSTIPAFIFAKASVGAVKTAINFAHRPRFVFPLVPVRVNPAIETISTLKAVVSLSAAEVAGIAWATTQQAGSTPEPLTKAQARTNSSNFSIGHSRTAICPGQPNQQYCPANSGHCN